MPRYFPPRSLERVVDIYFYSTLYFSVSTITGLEISYTMPNILRYLVGGHLFFSLIRNASNGRGSNYS